VPQCPIAGDPNARHVCYQSTFQCNFMFFFCLAVTDLQRCYGTLFICLSNAMHSSIGQNIKSFAVSTVSDVCCHMEDRAMPLYISIQRHRAVSLPKQAFLVGLCLQTAVNYLSKSDKY